jgi:hypothetical protein
MPEVGDMSRVGFFVLCLVLFIASVLVWRLIQWFGGPPTRPNPWDDATEASLHDPEALPLCPRCLEPDRDGVQFCRDCGFPVGPYVMWSPYLYLYAIGDLLRTGVDRPFRASAPILIFLLLFSASEYVVFAPVYWFFLFRNIDRHARVNVAS